MENQLKFFGLAHLPLLLSHLCSHVLHALSAVCACGIAVVPAIGAIQDCQISRASEVGPGVGANAQAMGAKLSGNGSLIAFTTPATNLATPDTNGSYDAVILDRATGKFEFAAQTSTGQQGNGGTGLGALTPDGRFVVFTTVSTNLDPRDTDVFGDLYIRDRVANTTRIVSRRTGPGSSQFGVQSPFVSSNGRFVSFVSIDSNFPVQNPTRATTDVYFVDMESEAFEVVSVGPNGERTDSPVGSGPISDDGRYVVFLSGGSAFGYSNPFGALHVWRRDRLVGTTVPVTVQTTGELAMYGTSSASIDLAMSGDGRFVAFLARPMGMVASAAMQDWGVPIVLVRDMELGITEPVGMTLSGNEPSSYSQYVSISSDGRFVGFMSYATNLLGGIAGPQAQAYRFDRLTKSLTLMSLNEEGRPAQYGIIDATMSVDGQTMAFTSLGQNLVPGDVPFTWDVFLRTCDRNSVLQFCETKSNSHGCKPRIHSRGTPSLSQGSGHELRVSDLVGATSAMFLWGTSGPTLVPFRSNQVLCVAPPLSFTPLQPTGGTAQTPCDGTLLLDFNAFLAANPGMAPAAGSVIHMQAWCFDPQAGVGATSLSDGVAFVLEP